jgi:hypothetical protein
MAMTPARGDSLSVWRRVSEAFGLVGASVGEHRAAPSGPEPWAGVVEHVHQDSQQRYVLVRLDEPSPGVALIGTHDKGALSHSAAAPSTNVSAFRYFYGDNAAAHAADAETRWRQWLAATFGVSEQKVAED